MSLHDQKAAYEQARRDYITAVKDAIKASLTAAFERPDVKNVIFGVSTQPYNDENAGTGTYGPLVNAFEGDFDRDKAYNLFYDYRRGSDSEASELRDVLALAGWEFAAEALGQSFEPAESYGGQEIAYVAERLEQPELDGRTYTLTEHDQSY